MRRVLLLAGVISLGLWFGVDAKADSGQNKKPAEQGKRESKLVTVTYSVADLVVPIAYNLEARKEKEATKEGALMRLICATVAPQSWEKVNAWDKVDRQTAIEYVPLGMGLVVRQTKEVHEEIAALLASLRRLQDMQVAMDIRMISVPDALAPQILGSAGASRTRKTALVMDEAQVHDMMETALRDKRTQILQSPKVTLFNGQRGSVAVTDSRFFLTGVSVNSVKGQIFFSPNNAPMELGFRSSICPTVSSDRRAVLVDLQVKRTTVTEPVPLIPVQVPVPQVAEDGKKIKNGDGSIAPPVQPLSVTEGGKKAKNGDPVIFQMFFQQPKIATQVVDQKFSVPVGKTAMIIAGNEQRQTKVEDTSLTATLLDWVGIRENVSYTTEACTTILLVTPRIINTEEHPDLFSGKKASVRPQGN